MRPTRTTTTLAALAALAAGTLLALACPGTAQAASCHRVHQQSGNGYGILNNTQINLPVDLDLDITDNALGILGLAQATAAGDSYTIHCGN